MGLSGEERDHDRMDQLLADYDKMKKKLAKNLVFNADMPITKYSKIVTVSVHEMHPPFQWRRLRMLLSS
jgi:hypothetical protein